LVSSIRPSSNLHFSLPGLPAFARLIYLCPARVLSPGSCASSWLMCIRLAPVHSPGSCAFAWLMCILLAHVHSPGSCASDQQVFTNTTSVIQLAMQPSDSPLLPRYSSRILRPHKDSHRQDIFLTHSDHVVFLSCSLSPSSSDGCRSRFTCRYKLSFMFGYSTSLHCLGFISSL